MRLTEVEKGIRVRLLGVDGDEATAGKLARYGLFPGDLARIVQVAPLDGPLLVESGGRQIALGRQVAVKILVEPA